MKTILIFIISTVAILFGVYGYNQEMRANALELKVNDLEMKTKDLQSRLDRQVDETIRLIGVQNKQHETIKRLENHYPTTFRNNQNLPIQNQNYINYQYRRTSYIYL